MDLRGLAGHFYDLAARILELFEEEEIVDVLCEVRIVALKGVKLNRLAILGQRE